MMADHPTLVWVGRRQYAVDANGHVRGVRAVRRWRSFGAFNDRKDLVTRHEYYRVLDPREIQAARAAAQQWRRQSARGRALQLWMNELP